MTEKKSWKPFIAGGISSTISSLITSPFEVVKIRLQAFHNKDNLRTGGASVLRLLFREQGLTSFYRGIGPHIVGVVPARSVYFGVLKYSQGYMKKNYPKLPLTITDLSSGALASFVTQTIINPMFVVTTRMRLQTIKGQIRYRNSFHCFRQIFNEEGLYGYSRGLTASYLGILESSIQILLYENLKRRICKENADRPNLTHSMLIAAVSKIIASVSTYPHEVFRTRLREFTLTGAKSKRTLISVVKETAKEGRHGLYGGMYYHLLRVVPNAAIMFSAYELISRIL